MTEAKIQGDCFVWFNNTYCLKHHTDRAMMFVVPNEMASTLAGILKGLRIPDRIITRATSVVVDGLKSVGLLRGVSDNIIVTKKGVFFVEFKLGKKGVQSDAQKEFEMRVNNLGYTYVLIRSVDQFKEFVNTHCF